MSPVLRDLPELIYMSLYFLKKTCLNFGTSGTSYTVQKMKLSIKDFFSKCEQIRSFLRILVTCTEETLNGKLHFFVE